MLQLSCRDVKETIHQVVFRGILQQGCHDLEQCLAQSCRANFGRPADLGFVLAGLTHTKILMVPGGVVRPMPNHYTA